MTFGPGWNSSETFIREWNEAGNSGWKGRISTIDLLTNLACYVKKEIMIPLSKAAYLNKLLEGGQLYWAFPFSKDSVDEVRAMK